MIGSLCPACGQPLPVGMPERCPACGTSLAGMNTDAPRRSKTISHPIVGGTLELPVIPQEADQFALSTITAHREQSSLFTWVGCLGLVVAVVGVGVLIGAIYGGLYFLILGPAFLLIGALVAFIFYRRSTKLDDSMDQEAIDLAMRDFHHFEG